MYQAVRETLESKPTFVSINSEIEPAREDLDYYSSLYYYTEEQVEAIKKANNSVSVITQTTTNRLFFDFDNKSNVSLAQKDTLALCQKLISLGVDEKSLLIYFSGNKGFHLEVPLDKFVTVEQFSNAIHSLASEYATWDGRIKDANRIIRLPNTKHPISGLYKIPLKLFQLKNLTVTRIEALAHNTKPLVKDAPKATLEPRIFENTVKKPVVVKTETVAVDFSKKMKGWSNCKWALLNGYSIKPGNRHEKLICLAATAKSLNFPESKAYYLIKDAMKQGVARYPEEGGECPKSDLENIMKSVYDKNWRGGTYSCKDGKTPWLSELCESLGPDKCRHEEDKTGFIEVDKVFTEFKQFAKDIEKNTIKTGIKQLDDAVRCRTGQMVGVLGAPSSGKTSLALEILENVSKQNLLCVFYSLDMSMSELFQKIAQRVTKLSETNLFFIFQNDPEKTDAIRLQVCEAYRNIKFCFDTGISVENIQNSINEFEREHNKKVSLLLLDYNELLSSPFSDSTASSGYNAGALKKLTNINQICTISLLQPPKVVGDASDEIVSYRSIKGSSLLEQCFSIVIGVFRPGFSPKNNCEDDKFLVMNILKNRLGKLANLRFTWDGLSGKINEILNEDDEHHLQDLINKKRSEKNPLGFQR